jgi:hypothetical protein
MFDGAVMEPDRDAADFDLAAVEGFEAFGYLLRRGVRAEIEMQGHGRGAA